MNNVEKITVFQKVVESKNNSGRDFAKYSNKRLSNNHR